RTIERSIAQPDGSIERFDARKDRGYSPPRPRAECKLVQERRQSEQREERPPEDPERARRVQLAGDADHQRAVSGRRPRRRGARERDEASPRPSEPGEWHSAALRVGR